MKLYLEYAWECTTIEGCIFLSYAVSEEWAMADVICKYLKVFNDATKKISGIKYPTANTFFFDVCIIYTKLLAWKNIPHDYVSAMEEKMMAKFRKYWEECSLVLFVATVFDPRYKLELVKIYHKTIDASDAKGWLIEFVQLSMIFI